MLRRLTRSVASATPAPPSELMATATDQTGTLTESQLKDREELPAFLFEDDPVDIETDIAPAVIERWNDPFAGGIALSDRMMKYGRQTLAPIENLPHSAMDRVSKRSK